MNEFEIIKNMPKGKYAFENQGEYNYLEWGKELISNLELIKLDGWDKFENNTFQIIPYDWDGLVDCNCYMKTESDKLYYSGASDETLNEYENSHMHDINCDGLYTNFYHKPTEICISWSKHVDGFEYINKKITYKQWQDIVQDCVKSVLKDKYIKPMDKVMLNYTINFGEHKITETAFMQKFNKFLKDNNWNADKINSL